MAKANTKVQRARNLKDRLARIKVAVMATDEIVNDYMDRKATELETFVVEINDFTREDAESEKLQ